MNGYWKAIIQEVVNKEKSTHPLRLTNTAIPQSFDEEEKKPRRIVQRYYLNEPYQSIYFTFQEARCLLYCRINSRYKSISQALNISERTVEFYLKNMREKLHCKNKKDLLKITEKGEFFKKYKISGDSIADFTEPV